MRKIKKFTTFLTLLIGLNALAKGKMAYELDMRLTLPGQETVSPKVRVLPNQSASVTQSQGDTKIFIDVTASDSHINNKDGILMNFIIGNITKDGKREIVSQPQIFSTDGKNAEITLTEKNKEAFKLSVTATKIAL